MNKNERKEEKQKTLNGSPFAKSEFQSLEIKILNVELEKGYAASAGDGGGITPWQPGTW